MTGVVSGTTAASTPVADNSTATTSNSLQQAPVVPQQTMVASQNTLTPNLQFSSGSNSTRVNNFAPTPQFSSGSNRSALTNYLPTLNEVSAGGATLFVNAGNYGSNKVSTRVGGIQDRYAPYSVGQPSYFFQVR
jgi:hypothetical protein